MFQIGKTIVSEDLLKQEFVCNLSACKGACCIEGDAGAPLEEEELQELEACYPKLKGTLREEAVRAIEEQGLYTTNEFGEHETTLIDGGACAYAIFDEKNHAQCGIEEAYNEGRIAFNKPISCHLYPVRIQKYSSFSAVNYHQWDICDDACVLGKELKVPTYVFVKKALIRKFGEDWYKELEQVAQNLKQKSV